MGPIGVKYDIESGAFIHAGQDINQGRFVVGDVTTQFLNGRVSIRVLDGFIPTASFHTHGNWAPGIEMQDMNRDIDLRINGYVSGAGPMVRFNFATRTSETVRP